MYKNLRSTVETSGESIAMEKLEIASVDRRTERDVNVADGKGADVSLQVVAPSLRETEV